MTHSLTYLQKRRRVYATVTWISPSGWTEDTIRADFERRFPDCTIIAMEKQQ